MLLIRSTILLSFISYSTKIVSQDFSISTWMNFFVFYRQFIFLVDILWLLVIFESIELCWLLLRWNLFMHKLWSLESLASGLFYLGLVFVFKFRFLPLLGDLLSFLTIFWLNYIVFEPFLEFLIIVLFASGLYDPEHLHAFLFRLLLCARLQGVGDSFLIIDGLITCFLITLYGY